MWGYEEICDNRHRNTRRILRKSEGILRWRQYEGLYDDLLHEYLFETSLPNQGFHLHQYLNRGFKRTKFSWLPLDSYFVRNLFLYVYVRGLTLFGSICKCGIMDSDMERYSIIRINSLIGIVHVSDSMTSVGILWLPRLTDFHFVPPIWAKFLVL